MFYYEMHGLGISSEMFFPELIKNKSNIDLVIKFGTINSKTEKRFRDCFFRNKIKVRFASKKAYLFWKDIEICLIKNGNKIIVNPKIDLDESFIRILILGNAMAILLHQRGRLILHANAVNMGGYAIGLIGYGGSGKSTTSLILHKKGYNLICDDMLSLEFCEDNLPIVYPSFPKIKLWPDTLESIHEIPSSFPKLFSTTEKRFYSADENFSHDPFPLKSFYLIEPSNELCIEELKPQNALIKIIESAYCYSIFNNHELATNLKQSAIISNNIPMKILKIQRSLEVRNKIVELIEDDLLNL